MDFDIELDFINAYDISVVQKSAPAYVNDHVFIAALTEKVAELVTIVTVQPGIKDISSFILYGGKTFKVRLTTKN